MLLTVQIRTQDARGLIGDAMQTFWAADGKPGVSEALVSSETWERRLKPLLILEKLPHKVGGESFLGADW